MTENERLLKRERAQLNHLVDEALRNDAEGNETLERKHGLSKIKRAGREALQSEAVQAQSRKVDGLVLMAEKEQAKRG